MARENSDWGNDRIAGAMANLGYRLSDQTVGNILQRHGIPPAPERQRTTTWADFIRAHLSVRYCQVNDIQTTQLLDSFIPLPSGHILGIRHLLPFTECPLAKRAIINRSRQVPTQPEQIADYTINRKKALSLSS